MILKDGAKKEGKLLEVADNYLLIEEQKGQGKKKELLQQTISFDDIKTTKIQIKFWESYKQIAASLQLKAWSLQLKKTEYGKY